MEVNIKKLSNFEFWVYSHLPHGTLDLGQLLFPKDYQYGSLHSENHETTEWIWILLCFQYRESNY